MQKIRSIFREANVETNFFISDIKNILLLCEKIFSETVCVLNLHMIFRGLGVAFFCLMTFYQGGVCAFCLTHSQSLVYGYFNNSTNFFLCFLTTFGSLVRWQFYNAYHKARPARISNLLAFVAIELLDCASRSICSRLGQRQGYTCSYYNRLISSIFIVVF